MEAGLSCDLADLVSLSMQIIEARQYARRELPKNHLGERPAAGHLGCVQYVCERAAVHVPAHAWFGR
jgi:hypothetical protein